MNLSECKPINILLVEDNEPDVVLTQEAFKDAKVANTLYVVEDGVEALGFLRREKGYADVPLAGSDSPGSESAEEGRTGGTG